MPFDYLFGLDSAPHADEENELLITVFDNVQLCMIRGILEAEKIPYLVRERGSGSAVKIISGFSLYGSDVFVEKNCIERARDLIDAYVSAPDAEETDGLPETNPEEFPDGEDTPSDEEENR